MIDIGHDIGNFDFFVGHSAHTEARARFLHKKKEEIEIVFRELGRKTQIDDC